MKRTLLCLAAAGLLACAAAAPAIASQDLGSRGISTAKYTIATAFYIPTVAPAKAKPVDRVIGAYSRGFDKFMAHVRLDIALNQANDAQLTAASLLLKAGSIETILDNAKFVPFVGTTRVHQPDGTTIVLRSAGHIVP